MPILKPFFRHVFSKDPPHPSQRYYFAARSGSGGSVWIGKFQDDRAKSGLGGPVWIGNFQDDREFLELEREGSITDKILIHGMKA